MRQTLDLSRVCLYYGRSQKLLFSFKSPLGKAVFTLFLSSQGINIKKFYIIFKIDLTKTVDLPAF
jgi:hypothetical protein